MILSYEFNCSRSGCKAYVHVTMHMHDEHECECDLEQLGSALGFRRSGSPEFLHRPWECITHDEVSAGPCMGEQESVGSALEELP